jgi:glycosyltransferase involved in cell wall biosynthesis
MASTDPKISIVMPSFNQAGFLPKAIDSVLSQDYSNIELVVLDGGSTDGSLEILEQYGEKLAFWCSEPDKGQSDALNKGLQRITGDIVGWLNSDDTYQPGTFAEVATALKLNSIAMCKTFGFMDSEGKVFGYKDNSFVDHQTLIQYWKTNGMTINQPCVFMRREVLDGLNPVLDPTLHYAMDYDLWLRLSLNHPIRVVEGYWANYRFHDSSKSGLSFDAFFPEWLEVSQRFWGRPWGKQWLKLKSSYLFHNYVLRAVNKARRISVLAKNV